MARYEQTYSGERRTSSVHVQLTTTERAQLENGARDAGSSSLSAYVRTLTLRRLAEPGVIAGTRQNPDARKLAYELSAIGNNLNQLTHIANIRGNVPARDELRAMTGLLKAAFARVIAL